MASLLTEALSFTLEFGRKFGVASTTSDLADGIIHKISAGIYLLVTVYFSAKQIFGSPMQCLIPGHVIESYGKYAEQHCYVTETYYVAPDIKLRYQDGLPEAGVLIGYYGYTSIYTFLLCLLAVLPNLFWVVMHRQHAGIVRKRWK